MFLTPSLGLILRLVQDTFDDCQEATIGAAFFTQALRSVVCESITKFEIWDTAGDERYASLLYEFICLFVTVHASILVQCIIVVVKSFACALT